MCVRGLQIIASLTLKMATVIFSGMLGNLNFSIWHNPKKLIEGLEYQATKF